MASFQSFLANYAIPAWGLLMLALGVVVYRANTLRAANRSHSLLFFIGGLWIINFGYIARGGETILFHLRIGGALAAFLPFMVFILTRDLSSRYRHHIRLNKYGPWLFLIIGIVLSGLTRSESFISYESDWRNPVYGPSWVAQHLSLSLIMGLLCAHAFHLGKALPSPSRSELYWASLGSSAAGCIFSAYLGFLGEMHPHPKPEYALVVIIYIAGLTWRVVFGKIYNTRSIIFILLKTAGIVTVAAGIFIASNYIVSKYADLTRSFSLIFSSLLAAAFGNYATRLFLQRHNALLYESTGSFQRAIITVTQAAVPWEEALIKMEEVLASHLSALHSRIFVEDKDGCFKRGNTSFKECNFAWASMNRAIWTARDSIDFNDLSQKEPEAAGWLSAKSISLLMLSVKSTQHINIAVAIGPRTNATNYTYQELERLGVMLDLLSSSITLLEASSQARQAGQLMALGLMSASVVHEVKQPLASLRLFFKLLPKRYGDPQFRADYFDLIPTELSRIESSLSQLLRLGRTENYSVTAHDPSPAIRDVLTLIKPKAEKARINIVSEFKTDGMQLFADPTVVKQALLNLTLNAIQALEYSSKEKREVRVSTLSINKNYIIRITDSGPGISEEILEKLFRPFVSTKQDGFGLGLYITRDQVIKTGGDLTVVNLQDGGTQFELSFPSRFH